MHLDDDEFSILKMVMIFRCQYTETGLWDGTLSMQCSSGPPLRTSHRQALLFDMLQCACFVIEENRPSSRQWWWLWWWLILLPFLIFCHSSNRPAPSPPSSRLVFPPQQQHQGRRLHRQQHQRPLPPQQHRGENMFRQHECKPWRQKIKCSTSSRPDMSKA